MCIGIRILIIVAVISFLAACTSSIRIVDHAGRPIEGALVLYLERPQMLFGGGGVGACVTDADGKASGLPRPRYELAVLKPGFHPVVDQYPFKHADYRRGPSTGTIRLYPIKNPGSHALGYYAISGKDDQLLDLPADSHPFGIDLRANIDFGTWSHFDSVLELEADYKAFHPTECFFFESGRSSGSAQRMLEVESGDVFYILDETGRALRKVILVQLSPSKWKYSPWYVEMRLVYVNLEDHPEPVEPPVLPCDVDRVRYWREGESRFYDGSNVIEWFLDDDHPRRVLPFEGPLTKDEACRLIKQYLRRSAPYLDSRVLDHLGKYGIEFSTDGNPGTVEESNTPG